ncbi:WhiB family transcriptional regulator [Actinomyces culturomici]|uniref:WhiB family transcriptional regulator n=1 Tax=Actinomyces culturomici TaxID=1926276 RepID=UPI000E207710|nr:WhiB family transcriptional regulator [Actinomyces culturomici]
MSVEWVDEARCRLAGVDPEWFYSERPADVAAALATCRSCPVVAECMQWILSVDARRGVTEIWGVCGGLTRGQRREVQASAEAKEKVPVELAAEYPDLPVCSGGCGRLLVPRSTSVEDRAVFAAEAARGMCGACYRRARRTERRSAGSRAKALTGSGVTAA